MLPGVEIRTFFRGGEAIDHGEGTGGARTVPLVGAGGHFVERVQSRKAVRSAVLKRGRLGDERANSDACLSRSRPGEIWRTELGWAAAPAVLRVEFIARASSDEHKKKESV